MAAYNSDLGETCSYHDNMCTPGQGFPRHFVNVESGFPKCYEFCANVNTLYPAKGTTPVDHAPTPVPFRGGIAVGGELGYHETRTFLWPEARGSYTDFSQNKGAIGESNWNKACDATSYSYETTPWDYQNDWTLSVPGRCQQP